MTHQSTQQWLLLASNLSLIKAENQTKRKMMKMKEMWENAIERDAFKIGKFINSSTSFFENHFFDFMRK